MTIITNDSYSSKLQEDFKASLLSLDNGLVQISMLFDEDIVTTSGVVAYVYSLLAEKGINIREEMSSWTDIMIIIDEMDLAETMNILHL